MVRQSRKAGCVLQKGSECDIVSPLTSCESLKSVLSGADTLV